MNKLLFEDLDVSPEMLRAIQDMGFVEATPVQSRSILPILAGRDVTAQAPTGTGKTCAFGIPAVESIDPGDRGVQCLILCPTRELALQTTAEIAKLCKYKQAIRALAIFGGQPIDRQILALKRKPQILVATPGRLMDHMRRKTVRLHDLKTIVLDEADEMLNMGFREDIDEILQSVPEERQTILFSATLSPEILDITSIYQRDAELIRVTHKELTVPNISQYYVQVRPDGKMDAMCRLIDAAEYRLIMVFCNTKRMVDEVTEGLMIRGYQAEALHGDIKQMQRDKVMGRFRKGVIGILVATDVAARGIDVDNVDIVLNYDVPEDQEYYVHRIGRTGRANRQGISYTLVTGRQIYKLRDIMRYTKSPIQPMKLPSLREAEEMKMQALFQELSRERQPEELQLHREYLEKFFSSEASQEIELTQLTLALLERVVKAEFPQFGEEEDPSLQVWQEPQKERSRSRRNPDEVSLFLNIGRFDHVEKKNIFQLFEEFVPTDVHIVGKIEIRDTHTFVTVPQDCAPMVVKKLKNVSFRGRTVRAEITNGKSRQNEGDSRQKKGRMELPMRTRRKKTS